MPQLYSRLVRVRTGKFRPETVADRIRAGLRHIVRRYGLLIQNRIRMSMRMKKHGITRVIDGRKHTASAPGEAPAILTGTLYRSIVPIYAPDGFHVRFAPDVYYGKYLEYGTKRMAPRPHLVPAFDEFRAAFRADVKRMINKEV